MAGIRSSAVVTWSYGTGATCTAIELVDCGGPELVRTDVSCQLDRFGCTGWLARRWEEEEDGETLANETPVCVTIRDCCTAGFDVHLQASIHPPLSILLLLLLSFCPRFISCRAFPSFVSSPLLPYPIRGTDRGGRRRKRRGKAKREGKGLDRCASIVRGDAKVQKRRSRNRRSEEKEAKRAGGSGRRGG